MLIGRVIRIRIEPYRQGIEPLSDEERAAAVEAAKSVGAYAMGAVDDPDVIEPIAADETGEQREQREQRNQERLEQRRRDMQAGQPGAYSTRQAQTQRATAAARATPATSNAHRHRPQASEALMLGPVHAISGAADHAAPEG